MGKNTDTTFLCIKLKELRESHDCTMDEMAKKLSVFDNGIIPNKSSISRLESGNTSEKTLIEMATRYCKAFGLTEKQIERFMRGTRIAIPDTSALLKNSQLIDELNKEYDKVIIPKVVVDELDYNKNHNSNTTIAKKAWEIIRGIGYGDKVILMDYNGTQHETNDNKIISIAREAAVKYSSKVDIITEDTDFSAYLKEDEYVTAIHLRDYMKSRQEILNMDRMEYFDSLFLDSYEGVEKPTEKEVNGYLGDGNTLIISAIRNNGVSNELRKEKIKWLIQCGADINERDCSRRYFPPLTHAVQKNDIDMVKFLLNECNANPNVGSRNPHDSGYLRQKNEGNMPLMVAAWHGRETIVRLLCENEKTSINQQDANGFTALMKACMNGKIRCRDILLEFHADVKIVDINGLTYEDHYNKFLENGPEEKRFDRGNNKGKSFNHNRRN